MNSSRPSKKAQPIPKSVKATNSGTPRWPANEVFGLHVDLHAELHDKDLGIDLRPEDLAEKLRLSGAQWVQCDCKGHPGLTVFETKLPLGTRCPGLARDLIKDWREATRILGIPLHVHYSGVFDKAITRKRPSWRRIGPDGKPDHEHVCPRSPFAEQLVAPHLIELAQNWGADGAWVDGEMCLTEACWCAKCQKAYFQETGEKTIPSNPGETDWSKWMAFSRRSFRAYIQRWIIATHDGAPGMRLTSAWSQTFHDPGKPFADLDWISGDDASPNGLDNMRSEARFVSTRGKPWDFMLWSFYQVAGDHGPKAQWTAKSLDHLLQEAAYVMSFGGRVQVYEHPMHLRSGSEGGLVEWRMRRIGQVAQFVKKRARLVDSTIWLHIAVLHSEAHAERHITGQNLLWCLDANNVTGAVQSLGAAHLPVDLLDEWALLPRLSEFPLVVVPEQIDLSENAVEALKTYVKQGGCLLLTGAGMHRRFGEEFLGCSVATTEADAVWHIPAGEGAVTVFSSEWLHATPTTGEGWRTLSKSARPDHDPQPQPAAVLHSTGKGRVLFMGADLFRSYGEKRYALQRELIREMVKTLAPRLDVTVQRAPLAVEVVPRRLADGTLAIHLVNRGSGNPTGPIDCNVEEIPPVGPIILAVRLPKKPRSITAPFERQKMTWKWKSGIVRLKLEALRVHETVIIVV